MYEINALLTIGTYIESISMYCVYNVKATYIYIKFTG